MDNRSIMLLEIDNYLNELTGIVKIRNKSGNYDVNKVSENRAINLFNLIYGFELKNANNILSANFPAIDLIDEDQKIAIQVTSTSDKSKITYTLNKFIEKGLYHSYSRLIIYILTDKTNYTDNTIREINDLAKDYVNFDIQKDVINNDDLSVMINNIVNIKHIRSVHEYLTDELSSKNRHKNILGKELNAFAEYKSEYLIGRKVLFDEIHSHFKSNNILLLNGIGGIGKTSIAKAYLEKYKDEYDHLAYIENTSTISVSLLTLDFLVESQSSRNINSEVTITQLVESLRHINNTLLVIDNCNDAIDLLKNKTVLESLRWKILITTRCKISTYQREKLSLDIKPLNENDALELFKINCRAVEEHEIKIIKRILFTIQYHTKLIILLARAAAGNTILALEKMAETVAQNDYSNNDLNIKVELDQELRKVYEFILLLFNPELLDKYKQELMLNFSVLPSQDIPIEHLQQLFLEDIYDTSSLIDGLNDLVKEGWLESSDNRFYRIHPLIQLVANKKLEPDQSNFVPLIERFVRIFNTEDSTDEIKVLQIGRLYLPYLQNLIDLYKEKENSSFVSLLQCGAIGYRILGDTRRALEFNLSIASLQEIILPENDPNLAHTYYLLAVAYKDIFEYKIAINYGEKALIILNKNDEIAYYREKCRVINTLSVSYTKDGTSEQALKIIQDSINNLEDLLIKIDEYISKEKLLKIRPEILLLLAESYSSLSIIYRDMEEYDLAIENETECMTIREDLLPDNHPSLATSYSNMGINYRHKRKYKISLRYHEKAISIRTKLLSEDNRHVEITYINLGQTHSFFKNNDQAIIAFSKALEYAKIRQPIDNLTAGNICGNISAAYHHKSYFNKTYYNDAIDWAEQAIKYLLNIYSPTHHKIIEFRKHIRIFNWALSRKKKKIIQVLFLSRK